MSYQYPPAAAAPPPPVDKLIQGLLQQVEMRNAGWQRFHIVEPGKQYATKVDTKKPELIGQAMALMGQPVAAEIREQQSTNINPNNGQPYTNRYLNAIAHASVGLPFTPQPGAPQQAPQYAPPPQQVPQYAPPAQPQQMHTPMVTTPPLQPGLQGYEKDINIMRQCAAKCVSMSWECLPEDQKNPIGFVQACEVWMAYFVYGPLRFGVTAFGGSAPTDNAAPQQQPQYAPAQYPQSEPAVCPECGYENTHAQGCPRDYSGS